MSEVKPIDHTRGTRNLDFDPQEVVGKYPNPVLRGALAFASATALTAGFVAGIGAIPDLGDPGTLNRERQELADEQADHTLYLESRTERALEADSNLDQLRINLGEGCVAVVQNYVVGGPLVETPEETIISDIESDDNQPCGDTRTELRASVRGLIDAEFAVADARVNLEGAQDYVIDDDLSGYESDAEDRMWLKGLALGAALGMLMGIPAAKYEVDYCRDKSKIAEYRLASYLRPRIAKSMNRQPSNAFVMVEADELAGDIVRNKMPELGKKG